MKTTTIDRLNQINKTFYEHQAQEFSQTRQTEWPAFTQSWKTIAPFLGPLPSILDLGCGNGRYLAFLQQQLQNFKYLGIDNSQPLLDEARSTYQSPDISFQTIDLVSEHTTNLGNKYDLIAVWGLMHHIPSQELRQKLLDHLKANLAPGGMLVVSFWQFLNIPRFRDKVLPAEQIDPIISDDLEPGDCLLPWGKTDSSAIRYCHHFSDDEVKLYDNKLNLECLSKFSSDGVNNQLNRIVIWQQQ